MRQTSETDASSDLLGNLFLKSRDSAAGSQAGGGQREAPDWSLALLLLPVPRCPFPFPSSICEGK